MTEKTNLMLDVFTNEPMNIRSIVSDKIYFEKQIQQMIHWKYMTLLELRLTRWAIRGVVYDHSMKLEQLIKILGKGGCLNEQYTRANYLDRKTGL
jgi:hypothetical protein